MVAGGASSGSVRVARAVVRRRRSAPGPAPAGSSGSGAGSRRRPASRGRQTTRPTRPHEPDDGQPDARAISGPGGRSAASRLRRRHHDHEVRGQPPRPLGAARPPSSGSTRCAPRPGRRSATTWNETESSVSWTSVTVTGGSSPPGRVVRVLAGHPRPARGPAGGERPVERLRVVPPPGGEALPRPELRVLLPRRPARGRSTRTACRRAGRPTTGSYGSGATVCAVAHLVDVPAARRQRRRGRGPARPARGPGSRRRASFASVEYAM